MPGRIEVVRGDITRLEVDAIVNAANERLLPGGGVCGAIHAAAGPRLAEACAEVGPCPTGDARITPGFDARASHIIHAVGPIWQGGTRAEPDLLAGAYLRCLELARDHGLDSIAFPALSTGIFGYPLESACAVAVDTIQTFLSKHERPNRVVLSAFDESTAAVLEEAVRTHDEGDR